MKQNSLASAKAIYPNLLFVLPKRGLGSIRFDATGLMRRPEHAGKIEKLTGMLVAE